MLRQVEDARLLQEFLDKDTTCQLCGVKEDMSQDTAIAVVALEHCDHRVCSTCTYTAIKTVQPTSQRDYVCPAPGCSQVTFDCVGFFCVCVCVCYASTLSPCFSSNIVFCCCFHRVYIKTRMSASCVLLLLSPTMRFSLRRLARKSSSHSVICREGVKYN